MKKHHATRLSLNALQATLAITFATLATPGQATQAGQAAAAAAKQPTEDSMRALAMRIISGDQTAFDALRAAATALYEGVNHDLDQDRLMINCRLMYAAFVPLGQAISMGNKEAFQAVKDSFKVDELSSFGSVALGEAAAGGHKESLDILVNYQKNGISEFDAVGALVKSASANIQPAVDFLIKEISIPGNSPFFYTIAEGLRGASFKGNASATAALAKLEKMREASGSAGDPLRLR